jgi:hypothetical protein
LEATLEKAAELLGYNIMFPVLPALAQKVNECHWYSHTMSNFARIGVNIFSLGPMDRVAMEKRRAENVIADTLEKGSGAALSYSNVTTLVET